MDEELGFDAGESGGALQGADGVLEQLALDLMAAVGDEVGSFDEEVSDDALVAFVDEIAVAAQASALDGGKAGEDAGVGVTEHHLGRGAVIPVERASPERDLFIDEGAEVGRGEMTEVENLHEDGSKGGSAVRPV